MQTPIRPPTVELPVPDAQQATRLGDISGAQWRSGIAAWLGWLFDGLDMHLYTLVAAPFVAQLLTVNPLRPVLETDARVGYYGSIIQATFLVGWALGGGFFGRIGDRVGRAHALMLTILTYAMFTGLSFFAQNWWHLAGCRFLAALGIGGEWAVGAALVSETWPKRWRPWIAAVLQSAVNVGITVAMAAGWLLAAIPYRSEYWRYRTVFLVGILPALIVLWIRRVVPEPEEWHTARTRAGDALPGIGDLFRGQVRRTTVLAVLVCSLTLTAHWAFMYWYLQHFRLLPEVTDWTASKKTQVATIVMVLVMVTSIVGNFLAGAIARSFGYRRTIALMCITYFLSVGGAYGTVRSLTSLLAWYAAIGVSQGVFGLFTMYLPPLFPTLLRTTGAGFSYNIGRIVAAIGTVVFGLLAQVESGPYLALESHRLTLLYSCVLFLPAAFFAMLLSEPPDERPAAWEPADAAVAGVEAVT